MLFEAMIMNEKQNNILESTEEINSEEQSDRIMKMSVIS